jgi:hypothetical protein
MSTRLSILALALLAVAGSAGVALAQGCAMCGSSFAPNDPATRAFNASVLFLMLTPYAVCVVAGACLVWLHRRGSARRGATVLTLPGRHVIAPDGPKEVTP